MEECPETLAFASEPVLACLANILTPGPDGEKTNGHSFAKDYSFLDIELKYGILQVSGRTRRRGDGQIGTCMEAMMFSSGSDDDTIVD